jgi:hypothetical protein
MIRRSFGIQLVLLVLAASVTLGSPAQTIKVEGIERLPRPKECTTPVRDPEAVSMIRLIASPERYDGKPVMVFGFYHLTAHPFHSASVLYLHKEDYEHELTLNSLLVERPEGTELNHGYAVVTGIFRPRSTASSVSGTQEFATSLSLENGSPLCTGLANVRNGMSASGPYRPSPRLHLGLCLILTRPHQRPFLV